MARVDCTFSWRNRLCLVACSQFLSSVTEKLVFLGGLTIRHVISIILTNFSKPFV